MILSVIIPTLFADRYLIRSLNFLADAIADLEKSEVLIILNERNSELKFVEKYNRFNVRKFFNEKNLGFSGSINKAVKEAKGEYLLFLNDDCLVLKNTIQKMLHLINNNKKIIATQPVIYLIKEKDFLKASIDELEKNEKIDNIGYIVNLQIGRAVKVVDKSFIFPLQKQKDIFKKNKMYGLSATCLLIKRKTFFDIGMFDESFHSYLEDIDLFIRLVLKDYFFYPTLDAKCFHIQMATSVKMGIYKQKRDFLNWIKIIKKNYPNWYIKKNFFSLFFERIKNINGLLKKYIEIFLKKNEK